MMNKKSTLLKRRKIAIVAAVIAVIVLVVSLVFVLDYVNATAVEDPADGTVYYVRKKDSVYSLYDTDKKTVLPTEEVYSYYVTHAGTLVDVDSEKGTWEIIATVDTEGNEQVGFNQRVLMFPHIEKANILKLEVHNSEGEFTFARMNYETGELDSGSDFTIIGSPFVSYDQELFASLYVSAGYTLTTQKISDPIHDENGEFTEYGLVAQTRTREVTDEDGNYVYDEEGNHTYEEYYYEPAYYVLTDVGGNEYKVIVGDMLVTGGGYYVQYVDMSGETEVKRDAVYVLSADIGDTMLVSVETFVTPQLTYLMSLNTYFDVENFCVFNKNENATGDDDAYTAIVGFSYIDLTERENTIKANEPYVFLPGFGIGEGYMASSNNIDVCLQGLYDTSFVGVAKLAPTDEDMERYGLVKPTGENENGEMQYDFTHKYLIVYDFDATDDNGAFLYTVRHYIFISEKTEDNTYYAYTVLYQVDDNGKETLLYDLGMIVEINSHSLEFLTWDSYDWINASYINLNIAFCDEITLQTSDYSAKFELDNSGSDSSQSISSSYLTVHATDSAGHDTTTFSSMVVTDDKGNVWTITASEITCVNSAGTSLTISTAYYDYNVMGTQVRVVSGYISCADGSKVYVTADEVKVVTAEGTTNYVRYDTNLFRQFYKTLLYATIVDSYNVSDEEEAAICTDEKLMLTMTVRNTEGTTYTYRFYKLTSRKAYITVSVNDGEAVGGFYVMVNRVEKFVSDAQRFFACELIDSTSKT